MPTHDELKILQALPLEMKVRRTEQRLREFVGQLGVDGVYIAFSGGKDSTVLLDIARRLYPEIPAVYCDTGLEYPEIRQFVRTFDHVEMVRPKKMFPDVLRDQGYPLVSKEVSECIASARRNTPPPPLRPHNDTSSSGDYSSAIAPPGLTDALQTKSLTDPPLLEPYDLGQLIDLDLHQREKLWELMGQGRFDKNSRFNYSRWLPLAERLPVRISNQCCYNIKKAPMNAYKARTKRVPILATLAEESFRRTQAWEKTGCNSFTEGHVQSKPMSFWREQDVLQYIVDHHLPIAEPYGQVTECKGKLQCTGCQRTGCVFCGFGMHLEKGETRFERLAKTHPKQYEYSIGGGQWIDNPDYDSSLKPVPDVLGWIPWNPKQIWVPSKEGLGMGKVFDMANEVMGRKLWRY